MQDLAAHRDQNSSLALARRVEGVAVGRLRGIVGHDAPVLGPGLLPEPWRIRAVVLRVFRQECLPAPIGIRQVASGWRLGVHRVTAGDEAKKCYCQEKCDPKKRASHSFRGHVQLVRGQRLHSFTAPSEDWSKRCGPGVSTAQPAALFPDARADASLSSAAGPATFCSGTFLSMHRLWARRPCRTRAPHCYL